MVADVEKFGGSKESCEGVNIRLGNWIIKVGWEEELTCLGQIR